MNRHPPRRQPRIILGLAVANSPSLLAGSSTVLQPPRVIVRKHRGSTNGASDPQRPFGGVAPGQPASQPVGYQFHTPAAFIVAANTTARAIAASTRTTTTRPTPIRDRWSAGTNAALSATKSRRPTTSSGSWKVPHRGKPHIAAAGTARARALESAITRASAAIRTQNVMRATLHAGQVAPLAGSSRWPKPPQG